MDFSREDFKMDIRVRSHAWSMTNYHRHSSYEIFSLSEGERTLLFGNKIFVVYPGDILLVQPNVLHKSVGDTPYKKYGAEFSEKYLDFYFSSALKEELTSCFDYRVIHLGEKEFAEYTALFEKMFYEFNHGMTCSVTLSQILMLLTRADKKHKREISETSGMSVKTAKRIDSVIAYISLHFADIKSIDQIAENCYLNKSYMCRLFKRETGMTVMEYLYNHRIQEACELLQNTKCNISDAAHKCGFENTSHFIKVFKSMLGCTPKQFIKSGSSI